MIIDDNDYEIDVDDDIDNDACQESEQNYYIMR